MFNFAIFRKTLRDGVWACALSSVGLIAFVVLFVWAMQEMGTEVLEMVSNIPFLLKIFETSFGIEISGDVSLNLICGVCFTHGVVLALTWTVIIAATTRVTAGEIDRGTADILLALPVSRSAIYFSTTLAWLLFAVVLAVCPLLGFTVAKFTIATEEPIDLASFVPPAVNFFFLNVAVGGISAMIGGILNRRGVAVGMSVGVIVSSYVVGILVPLAPGLERFSPISLMSYFRPVDLVLQSHFRRIAGFCICHSKGDLNGKEAHIPRS
jgi:ABC-type transport system involved in multi-copper enzyme maturation permease subunit